MASLEASVEERLGTMRAHAQQSESQPFTIFRVPSYVRESNRTAYEPRMVSIGPYHHGSPSLRAMEDHKWRYLDDLLSREQAPTSATLIAELRSLEARARACYSERPEPEMDSDEFVQMLLLDGSFIIEFYFKWHTEEADAICDVGWGFTLINADLLLLENQIPFFVVERLFDAVMGPRGGRENLFNMLLLYLNEEEPIAYPSDTCEFQHLLHLYYESFVPKWQSKPMPSSQKKTLATPPDVSCAQQMSAVVVNIIRRDKTKAARGIPRATEMSAAGVTFVRRKEEEAQTSNLHVYHLNFDRRRGVMEIPHVVVDDMTQRPLLVNLIAFEQTKGQKESGVVASYVTFMSMLIRGKEDVQMLRQLDILDNLLADDDEVARFFSHLGDGVAINYEKQVFTELYKDVQRYCDSWRHRNRATLMRDYFRSPWSAIAVAGAAVGLALTATQTYFAVFPA